MKVIHHVKPACQQHGTGTAVLYCLHYSMSARARVCVRACVRACVCVKLDQEHIIRECTYSKVSRNSVIAYNITLISSGFVCGGGRAEWVGVCVCTYVCECMCMYVCMYECMYVCIRYKVRANKNCSINPNIVSNINRKPSYFNQCNRKTDKAPKILSIKNGQRYLA